MGSSDIGKNSVLVIVLLLPALHNFYRKTTKTPRHGCYIISWVLDWDLFPVPLVSKQASKQASKQ